MAMTIHDMVADLRTGFEEKLKVEGKSFAAQLRKARRHLPHKVQREATYLVQSIDLMENPKLARMVDARRVRDAYYTVRDFLDAVDLPAQRSAMLFSIAGSIAFALLVTAILVLVVLVQRGFV